VRNKEAMFSKERGHNSRETKIVSFYAKIFFCCGRSYCMDPYSPYDYVQSIQLYGFGMEIEAFQA
jgi:hypothetical protein